MRRFTCFAAIMALTFQFTTALADPLFGARTDFATGSYPFSVAIGDVNGDGRPDLATANYGAGTVSVLLGNGDGTFGGKSDFPTGSNPRFVAMGDLNGDGIPDLALANLYSATVSVLLGHGDGTFGAKTDYATGSQPYALAIGDLDGDGRLDLAVANSASATVSVLPGNGNGTFGAKHDFATGSQPYSVAIGDLNADGRPDLAVASGAGVSVLLGNGGGTFAAKTDYPTGSLPVSVTIGDVNGDGRPDLAVANYYSNTVSVLAGNGNGTFAAKSDFATGVNPFVVAIGNLNGDAHPDLAVANSSSNSVSVLLGNGAGAFAAKSDFAVGSGPFSVAIGDLNADGRPDMAVTNFGSNTVSVLLRQLLPTGTIVSTSPNPSTIGGSVTLTALVTPSDATGSVTFRDGADSLGTAALSAGVATLTTSALALGDHLLTAAYGGNATYAASASFAFVHTVSPFDSTTLDLAASPSPSRVGQAVTLTASIAPEWAGGSVEFRDHGALLGTAALTGGVATLSVPAFAVGSHDLSAVYGGSFGFYGTTSPVLVHVVDPAPTVVALASSPNPSRLTEAVAFTATVTDSAAGSAAVAGTVAFAIDGVAAGEPVALVNGAATLGGVTNLAEGPHSVLATYSGSASYVGSTSPAFTHVVSSPRPVLLAVRDVPGDQGGQVDLTWSASGLDLEPLDGIDSYWILRSVPAAEAARARLAGARVASIADGTVLPRRGAYVTVQRNDATYYWEYIDSQPALHTPAYDFVAPTTCDSAAGANPLTAFMIMARTADGAQWWFSDPDSGYSVDDLSPPAPAPFTGTYAAGVATLHWAPGPETDLAQYRLYRGATPDFVPAPDNLVMAQPDTGYVDDAGSLLYYKLCAVDTHGNPSDFAALLPTGSDGTAGVGGGVTLAFALEGARPNPSRGEQLGVAFTLPTSEPARLELVDVSGRRVAEREVGTLGAGRHSTALTPDRGLAPGLYLLRLTQGASVRVSRVTVIR